MHWLHPSDGTNSQRNPSVIKLRVLKKRAIHAHLIWNQTFAAANISVNEAKCEGNNSSIFLLVLQPYIELLIALNFPNPKYFYYNIIIMINRDIRVTFLQIAPDPAWKKRLIKNKESRIILTNCIYDKILYEAGDIFISRGR